MDAINKLQYFSCEENIFFRKSIDPKYAKSLHEELGEVTKREFKWDITTEKEPSGLVRELHHSYSTGIDYDLDLTFLKNKIGVKKSGLARNPRFVEIS